MLPMPPRKQSTDVAVVDEDADVELVSHEILGEKFKLRKGVNDWLLLRAMDEENPSGVTKLMLSMVAGLDRPRFNSMLGRQQNMTIEDVMEIFQDMYEAVADGRPTKPSSGSRRTTPRKVVSRPSAAR
jgi:hypothetical protein